MEVENPRRRDEALGYVVMLVGLAGAVIVAGTLAHLALVLLRFGWGLV